MKIKRIISALLTFVMVLGSISISSVIPVSAAWEDKVDENGDPIINYITKGYQSAEEKLKDMVLYKEQDGYQLYIEEFTGEIAFLDKSTGQIMFSNPYDIAAGYNWASNSTKQQLLSQIILTYEDNGVDYTMYSYVEAALRGQIQIKNIKNGVRVEYTVGELATMRLVPRLIKKSRFEELILKNIDNEWYKEKLISFYNLKDPNNVNLTERNVKEMQAAFPITKKMAVYVCDPGISDKQLRTLETIVKTYCPNYTFEEMEQDHTDTEYVSNDTDPPNFKMAIEYTIDKEGLEARLPANGIRFDESIYRLKSVSVLPYMGAGSNEFKGYTFIPDGSGTLIRFEDLKGVTYNVAGQMYGPDYAYHTITGQHAESMRLPVFGIVTNYAKNEVTTKVIKEAYFDPVNGENHEAVIETTEKYVQQDNGVFAIITEGDSMATLMNENGGQRHCYNTVYAKFNPRPSDTYNLADSISIGSNASWTVVTDRKYTGSYRIKYIMLKDNKLADKNGIKDYYESTYVGMAEAYRDYLVKNEVLTRLTDDDVEDNIPLYIETFGSIKTVGSFLSFPVSVNTPLTTFDNIKTMYNELSEAGVKNLNFRLTGFYNGGLRATYPTKIEWVEELGGKSGFEDLVAYSKEKNFGVFPEFDFAYISGTNWFDGISTDKDAVKTIDDRFTSRRYYDAATQSFEKDFSLAVSASVYEKLYEKFSKNYKKFGNNGISVSTLGTDLNSDFDDEDPYNREDTMAYTIDALKAIKEDFGEVMVDGGNAYSLKYADHILNVATDSSNYLKASEAVPFTGMVLHGFVNYAGNAINMEGDVNYSLLKAIENGSSLFFTLSYQNTTVLKNSGTFNKYYSVSYDIWKEDLISYYKTINEAISDLQTSLIVDHEFIKAERIPDEDEIAADKAEAERIAAERAAMEKARKEREALEQKLKDRQKAGGLGGASEVTEEVAETTIDKNDIIGDIKDKIDEETTRSGIADPSKATDTATGSDTTTKTPETTVDPDDVAGEVVDKDDDKDEVVSKYATTSGTVVRVEYENGASFILNYNSFDITVNIGGKAYTVEALGFIRLY